MDHTSDCGVHLSASIIFSFFLLSPHLVLPLGHGRRPPWFFLPTPSRPQPLPSAPRNSLASSLASAAGVISPCPHLTSINTLARRRPCLCLILGSPAASLAPLPECCCPMPTPPAAFAAAFRLPTRLRQQLIGIRRDVICRTTKTGLAPSHFPWFSEPYTQSSLGSMGGSLPTCPIRWMLQHGQNCIEIGLV